MLTTGTLEGGLLLATAAWAKWDLIFRWLLSNNGRAIFPAMFISSIDRTNPANMTSTWSLSTHAYMDTHKSMQYPCYNNANLPHLYTSQNTKHSFNLFDKSTASTHETSKTSSLFL